MRQLPEMQERLQARCRYSSIDKAATTLRESSAAGQVIPLEARSSAPAAGIDAGKRLSVLLHLCLLPAADNPLGCHLASCVISSAGPQSCCGIFSSRCNCAFNCQTAAAAAIAAAPMDPCRTPWGAGTQKHHSVVWPRDWQFVGTP